VKDCYHLDACDKPLVINLLAYHMPKIEAHCILFSDVIAMAYDNTEFNVDIEKITITDKRLMNDWEKDDIYKLILTQKERKSAGQFSLCFKRR